MNKNTVIFVSFVAGVAVGAASAVFATKRYFETREQQRADEEIESVRSYYKKWDEQREKIKNSDIEKRAYEIIAEKYAPTDDQKISEKKKENKEETIMEERPYVIEPEEFDTLGYKTVSLNYYDDGVLTYENDDIIENVDELVGRDSLSHLGEYESDAVYVRNDTLKTDFEILADTRRYEDIY